MSTFMDNILHEYKKHRGETGINTMNMACGASWECELCELCELCLCDNYERPAT
jgi:hypothetical protein